MSCFWPAQASSSNIQISKPCPQKTILDDRIQEIDAVVNQALERFQVPGAAIGIVFDGKVVLTKGYGMRDQKRALPVTENTIFAIGSCTKGFTSFVLGQLVDEGVICWDDPVIKYIPEFRLKSLHTTKHITIRDLACHRSGYPRHEFLWLFNQNLTRADFVNRLQFLDPAYDLRERFEYSNVMYAVLGHLIEKVTGQTWEDAIKTRIFIPVGMDHSNLSVLDSQMSPDFSLPYTEKDGVIHTLAFRNIFYMGPAGAINASVSDMAKWIQMQLSDGFFSGTSVIKKETLQQMHTLQSASPQYPNDTTYSLGYGLGWGIGMHKGHYLVRHGGGIDGFISEVSLLLQDKIGIVVLSNSSEGGAHLIYSVSNTLCDMLLGTQKENWIDKANEERSLMQAAVQKKQNEQTKQHEEIKQHETMPSHPLKDYAGTYEHSGYGTINILVDNKHLKAAYGNVSMPMKHRYYDIFTGSVNDLVFDETWNFSFVTDSTGAIRELHIPFEPSIAPIVFKRKTDCYLLEPAYLKQFEGTFNANDLSLKIYMRGQRLFGQIESLPEPEFELLPKMPLFFFIKGTQGTLCFIKNSKGQISEIVFSCPQGIFNLKPQ